MKGSLPVTDNKVTQFSLLFPLAVNVPHLNVIQSLDLSQAGILTLSDSGFRDYDSLKFLDITQSEISSLKSSWFTKKTIEVLNVSDNVLTALKKEDMKFFNRLRVFNASSNEIKTLEANTFLDSKKLEVISLSNNQLTSVVIDNLENLKHLYLRENAIATVSHLISTRNGKDELNLSVQGLVGFLHKTSSTGDVQSC